MTLNPARLRQEFKASLVYSRFQVRYKLKGGMCVVVGSRRTISLTKLPINYSMLQSLYTLP